jgi:L-ascorbate metabolism protein UlaG (beta-lactamase superfamily)
MKRNLLTLLLLAVFSGANAQIQRPAADRIDTKKGPLLVQPVSHASLVLTWDNKTIYVDPSGGSEAYTGLNPPDLVLITDIHGDHCDTKTLAGLNTAKATFVVPQAVADKLGETAKAQVVVLPNGDKTQQAGVSITAVPMYNLPEAPDSRHPKGRGNGYVLDLGGKQVYLSGDTEDIPEMRALKNIDVAFVCMNLPYTMDVDQAAAGVMAFKPKIVYPYHYRGQNGLSDVEAFRKAVAAGKNGVEVRLRNWYPAP